MKKKNQNKKPSQNSLTKKEIILKTLANGDKRSYNEIAADIELAAWKNNYVRI